MLHFTTSTHGRIITPQKRMIPPKVGSLYIAQPIHDGEDKTELAWLSYLMHQTPNGHLYFDNDTRHTLESRSEMMFVHATLSLDAIKASGELYPSVGCLGAAIFSVPLANDGRLHSFSRYIIEREIPMVQRIKGSPDIHPQLIGIKLLDPPAETQAYSFNYLHLGQLQYDVYQRVAANHKAYEHRRHFAALEQRVCQQIKRAKPFLNRCQQYTLNDTANDVFFAEWHDALQALPFLGYIYFEVLSEYVQLHQQDNESRELVAKGQLNIRHFKDLVYGLEPSLSAGFDLEKFQPTIAEVTAALQKMHEQRSMFETFDSEAFMTFMKWRLAQYIRLHALGGKPVSATLNIADNSILSGHIIHRLIGEMKVMKPYLEEYDMERARVVWQDWQANGISFVENAVMPRGEVGINPGLPMGAYEIYELAVDPKTGRILCIEKLDVTIVPRFTGSNVMGSSNNPKQVSL